MKCIYCEKEFKIIPTGKSGGMNRHLCYECLPEGLDQDIVNSRARILLNDKIRRHKESLGCSICGYDKNGAALDWHHLDPSEKEFNPAEIIKHSACSVWEEYQKEIKKCILVCANCHRELHNPIKPIPQLEAVDTFEKLRQEILDLYNQYKSVRKVAEILSKDKQSIANILHYYGIDTSFPAKSVVQLDKKTNSQILVYDSIADASRAMRGDESGTSHIADVCKGKRKSAYGYRWIYADDLDKS